MRRIGDEIAGFSVSFDPATGAVHVRGWGFWSADVAAVFAGTVREVCEASPRGIPLLMDMTGLKPLREVGQRSFGELVLALGDLGVGRTTVTTASHLTRLQLLRLVAEHGGKDSVEFATTAADATRRTPNEKERANR